MKTCHWVRSDKRKAVFGGYLPERLADDALYAAGIHNNGTFFYLIRMSAYKFKRIIRVKSQNHHIARRENVTCEFLVNGSQKFGFQQNSAVNIIAVNGIVRIVFDCLGY